MKLMMNGKNILALTILALVFSAQVAGAALTPLEQLKGTVEGILAIMNDAGLRAPSLREERRARIMAKVNERFDFAEMSRMTLGKNWQARTSAEKDEFQRLFSDLLKHNYIGRIEAYSDEKVVYAKEIFSQNTKDRAKVYTNILKNGHEIPIAYSLVKKEGDWFVYDVVIEGVSLVRNYRTEFERILSKEKFPGLVKRMQEKIESNEAQREKNE